MEPPRIHGDVTVTVTSSVAAELIERAGIKPGSADCWGLRNGSQTTDPRTALTDALVVIAEDEAADIIEDEAADIIEDDPPFEPHSHVRLVGDLPATLEQYRDRVGEVKRNGVIVTPSAEVQCETATVDFGDGIEAIIANEFLAAV
jgi:hypothetical protein